MHTHIPAASSLIYHPFKILDTKSPHSWKSNQHILAGLIRAVFHCLDMHPVECILHTILVYAATNCIALLQLWNAFAIFTGGDNYLSGVVYQLKIEKNSY